MANKNLHFPSATRSIRRLSFLAIGLLCLSGCIKEDLSDCPEFGPGIILKYRYDLNMDYADKFAERVENLQAFIFDREGILRDTLTPPADKSMIVPGWERRVNLAPGTYSILTWAGSDLFREHYFVAPGHYSTPEFTRKVEIGSTRLDQLRLLLKTNAPTADPSDLTPCSEQIKDLYHGLVQNITVDSKGFTTITTPLVKNTKTLRIRIEGVTNLDRTPNIDGFELSLVGSNSHYKFDNTIGEASRKLTYMPYGRSLEQGVFLSNIKTLRLMKPAADPFTNYLLQLNIKYTPTDIEICKDLNLVDLILSGRIPARDSQGNLLLDEQGQQLYTSPTLEYLDRQDVFDLKFVVEKQNDKLIVTVLVNDWKISNIYPA